MDMQQFIQNRAQFPPEELAKYAGKHIAWSPDGTQILAGDTDPGKVLDSVKALGYDPRETVLSFVPLPDEVILGGASLFVTEDDA